MFKKKREKQEKIQLAIYKCTYVLMDNTMMITTTSHVLALNKENAKQLLLNKYEKNITGINVEPVIIDGEKILQ